MQKTIKFKDICGSSRMINMDKVLSVDVMPWMEDKVLIEIYFEGRKDPLTYQVWADNPVLSNFVD